MKTGLVVAWLGILCSGCIEVPTPIVSPDPALSQQPVDRRIEVTINKTSTGSPCRVTYPPDPDLRDLRWVTGTEASFCQAIAQDARAAIEAKGWVCHEESSGAPAQSYQDQPGQERFVWLCSQS